MAQITLLQQKLETHIKANKRLKELNKHITKENENLRLKNEKLGGENFEIRQETPKLKGSIDIANRAIRTRDNQILRLEGKIAGLECAVGAIARNIN